MEKEIQSYSAYVEINLDNLGHNYETAKSKMKKETDVIAVIKADAYNHGAIECAKKLYSCGAKRFAVANIHEACLLRDSGISGMILVLGPTYYNNYNIACLKDISVTVDSLYSLKQLCQYLEETDKSIKVHIALNTGMNRIGFNTKESGELSAELFEALKLIKENKKIVLEGVFSHFCDFPNKEFTSSQHTRFSSTLASIEAMGLSVPLKHICNSIGTLQYNEYHLDAVRYGIALYGCEFSDESLLPVMSLKTHIVSIAEINAGEGIGYGQTFVAKRKMKIATISAGYADGYNRLLSNKGEVLIRGKRAKIVGRVCMDMTMVDITDIPEAELFDTVTLMGQDGDERITAEEIARLCDTISYEILCHVGKRVKRIYIENKS